jgi:hypothetical protein
MDGLYGWDYPSFDGLQGLDTLSSPEDGDYDFSLEMIENVSVIYEYPCVRGRNDVVIDDQGCSGRVVREPSLRNSPAIVENNTLSYVKISSNTECVRATIAIAKEKCRQLNFDMPLWLFAP